MMEAELLWCGPWTDIVDVMVEDTKPDGITISEAEFVADSQAQLNTHSVSDMAKACAEIILRVEGCQLTHLTSRDP
jgi:hypothetical protein